MPARRSRPGRSESRRPPPGSSRHPCHASTTNAGRRSTIVCWLHSASPKTSMNSQSRRVRSGRRHHSIPMKSRRAANRLFSANTSATTEYAQKRLENASRSAPTAPATSGSHLRVAAGGAVRTERRQPVHDEEDDSDRERVEERGEQVHPQGRRAAREQTSPGDRGACTAGSRAGEPRRARTPRRPARRNRPWARTAPP